MNQHLCLRFPSIGRRTTRCLSNITRVVQLKVGGYCGRHLSSAYRAGLWNMWNRWIIDAADTSQESDCSRKNGIFLLSRGFFWGILAPEEMLFQWNSQGTARPYRHVFLKLRFKHQTRYGSGKQQVWLSYIWLTWLATRISHKTNTHNDLTCWSLVVV